jgi:[lysine-biosynthesis-protein LysW]--L-2-aminoadipate ligase
MSADHFINDPLTDDGDIRLGVLVSHLRTEEKAIFASARAKNVDITPIFDRKIVIDLSNADGSANSGFPYDVVLDRSVAHSRALYT